MRFRLLAAAVVLTALPFAGGAAAHPYSTSRSEVDWNAATGRLEVALALLPEELVAIIGEDLGRPFRLDASEACDRAIADYLGRHFAATSPQGERARFAWVGKELAFEATWIYFELVFEKPPASLAGLKLRVDLGFELSHEHLNALRLRRGEEQKGLLFSRLEPEISLEAGPSR